MLIPTWFRIQVKINWDRSDVVNLLLSITWPKNYIFAVTFRFLSYLTNLKQIHCTYQ
jgi:hypothetical protein